MARMPVSELLNGIDLSTPTRSMNAFTNRNDPAMADVLHYRPAVCSDLLPPSAVHRDRLATCHHLGGLCIEPVRDGLEDQESIDGPIEEKPSDSE